MHFHHNCPSILDVEGYLTIFRICEHLGRVDILTHECIFLSFQDT